MTPDEQKRRAVQAYLNWHIDRALVTAAKVWARTGMFPSAEAALEATDAAEKQTAREDDARFRRN